MDNYNYSPNGIDYDPDLLYGGETPVPAPRKKSRPAQDRPAPSRSERAEEREAARPERVPRRQRQRADYDAVANREEIARRDRQRRDRDNETRLEKARQRERAEKARREQPARKLPRKEPPSAGYVMLNVRPKKRVAQLIASGTARIANPLPKADS